MEKRNISERKDLIWYFVFTYAISWSLWLPKVLDSNGYAIFGPLIAVLILIARKREERGIRRFLARAWDWF